MSRHATIRVRNSMLVGGLIVVALFGMDVPARAGPGVGGHLDVDHGGGVDADVDALERSRPSGGGTPGVAGAAGNWISYPVARRGGTEEDANRGWCRGVRWELVAHGQDAAARFRFRVDEYTQLFAVGHPLFGVDANIGCPGGSGDVLPGQVARDIVRRYVRSDQLPRPVVEVPPGHGLTGMPAFVVTSHSLAHELAPIAVDLGVTRVSLSWSASGRSEVDWGDGTVTSHVVAGVAWPDGEVVHTYRDRGTYRISVTDTWTVEYRIAGLTGTLTETLPAVTFDGFEVRERQSVRISGR